MGVTSSSRAQQPTVREAQDGEDLSGLRDLFMLSMAMFDCRSEDEVLRAAMSSVACLGSGRAEAGYLRTDGAWVRACEGPRGVPGPGLDEQIAALDGEDGHVTVPGQDRCEAFALRSGTGTIGYLVVSAAARLPDDERFLITALGQQTAAALGNAAGRRAERDRAAALPRANDERTEANARLRSSVAELEFQQSVHEALSEASTESEDGIADMVRAFTHLPVAVEDPFGNLRVWSGPACPDPYPRYGLVPREQELQHSMRRPGAVRTGDRLTCIAQHRGKVFGTISLVDPDRVAGDHEQFVLDHACVALALEMSHQRRLAEVELRLRRELVDDLITGTEPTGACARSEAVGHDLHGPHRIAVVEWTGKADAGTVAETLSRAATSLGLRFLLGRRAGATVIAVQGSDPPFRELYRTMARELGAGGSIGAGGRTDSPAALPRSYDEALQAMEFRRHSHAPGGATAYEELGFYRLLGTDGDQRKTHAFVHEWLGPLEAYDASHQTDLVRTLSLYFDCGGNYDDAAAALTIHRSTLRYRLRRIREVSGHDLGEPDTRLNLHVATRIWQVQQGSWGQS